MHLILLISVIRSPLHFLKRTDLAAKLIEVLCLLMMRSFIYFSIYVVIQRTFIKHLLLVGHSQRPWDVAKKNACVLLGNEQGCLLLKYCLWLPLQEYLLQNLGCGKCYVAYLRYVAYWKSDNAQSIKNWL